MPAEPPGEYVLGLDLGTNSLGWAIIALVDGQPANLFRAGVRVFDAGMEGDIESGQEQSRNLKRRQMRLQRRQTWRHARRVKKVFNLLRRFGLLPSGDASTSEKRQDLINELDRTIRSSDWFQARAKSGEYPQPEQTLPYILRAAALDERLEPHFLGRALYHLAQRRGFLSGRLRPAKADEEDEGKVKGTIKTLREQMSELKRRTLGEFLSHLSPADRRIRGPEAWAARDMYESEFDLICDAQSSHHPEPLKDESRTKLHDAVFHQRPLKFDPNVIGKCELEPDEHRAPAFLLIAQRFRMLQTVNNLRLLPPGEIERRLTPGDQKKLIESLDFERELKFTKIRKLLGLTKEYVFKGEAEGEKRVLGNRTSASFHKILGERWLALSSQDRDRLVECVHSLPRAKDLIPPLKTDWGFEDDTAEQLSGISLEPDYMNLSRTAMERLLPRLERGDSFMEARKAEYPESFKTAAALPSLPPLAAEEVQRRVGVVRNPTVTRCLSELRRVVNAIVARYGKPTTVRIELARQIRKSKKQRQAITKRIEENTAARERAKEKIKGINGDEHPSRDDIRRVQLFDDSHGHCVYCGESIAARNFLGKESQVDVDHIIPFSRSLDDSYMNLVICHSACNRAKGDRTPYEAFSGDAERYEQILDRVKRLAGDRRSAAEKLRRFKMNDDELTSFLDDFRKRQLNDTAYAARLSTRYLGLLYGGVADETHEQRVFAPSGQATYRFRGRWNLNSILGDGPTTKGGLEEKKRADHRHHAIDAVVIGVTDQGMIQRLADAAKRGLELGKRFAHLDEPWKGFLDEVRAEIDKIVVSHRVSKKVSGALHEETIYSRPFPVAAVPDRRPRSRKNGGEDTAATVVRVRKRLASLTKNEVGDIADPGVKKLVLAKLNGGDPKKVFASEENLPFFETSDGRRIPIKRLRINKVLKPFTLGQGRTIRHVTSESNHHVEIYAELDKDGNEGKWDGEVITMHEAYQRIRARKPVVQRDHGPLVKFKFSLAPGEVIECDDGKGARTLWVSRGVASYESGPRLLLVPLTDARQKKEMLKAGRFWSPMLNPLRKLNPRKVAVSPLGEVSEAHD